MISDNYVTGDNIYLRELQNFFFEVLGMMSITHYGAIGDGRRDNYGPLQVAIDDAHRRGLSFLYVPYGRFIYTGELVNYLDPDTGKPTIIFMGNPHSHIVNIRTGEEIEIHQFGWFNGDGGYYNKIEADERFVKIAGDTMTGPLIIGIADAGGHNSLSVGSDYSSGGTVVKNVAGHNSMAQGQGCRATGDRSHAEGRRTTASGHNSHAEGDLTVASDWDAHAEGYKTTASESYAHAEGTDTTASDMAAHAEGYKAVASGVASHAEGYGTIASRTSSHAQGKFNIDGILAHIVGNGTNDSNRSNAHTLDWDGNAWFSGDVYVGSTSGTNKDAGSKKLATEDYVISKAFPTSIAAEKNTDASISSNSDEITFDTYIGSGDYPTTLSFSSGVIKVGPGVTKVKVSAAVSFVPGTAHTYQYFSVLRKSGNTEYEYATTYTNLASDNVSNYCTVASVETIVYAQEGDEFSLKLTNFSGDTIKPYTFLTVTVVG